MNNIFILILKHLEENTMLHTYQIGYEINSEIFQLIIKYFIRAKIMETMFPIFGISYMHTI